MAASMAVATVADMVEAIGERATGFTAERDTKAEANVIVIMSAASLAVVNGAGGIAPATRLRHGSAMRRLHGGAKWTNAVKDYIVGADRAVIAGRTIELETT
jgi:hypothetical protein